MHKIYLSVWQADHLAWPWRSTWWTSRWAVERSPHGPRRRGSAWSRATRSSSGWRAGITRRRGAGRAAVRRARARRTCGGARRRCSGHGCAGPDRVLSLLHGQKPVPATVFQKDNFFSKTITNNKALTFVKGHSTGAKYSWKNPFF